MLDNLLRNIHCDGGYFLAQMAQYGAPNSEDSKEGFINPFNYKSLSDSKAVFFALIGLFAGFAIVLGAVVQALELFGFCTVLFFAATIKQLELITEALKTANKLAASGLSK